MKIYTKTGDKGYTSLLGGTKVAKSNVRIEAYGTVDELNAYLGWIRDKSVNASRKKDIIRIQENLFVIGSHLAKDKEDLKMALPAFNPEEIAYIEKLIDQMEDSLPVMTNFILPGGKEEVSLCHVARCVCRRAERSVVRLNDEEAINPNFLVFLNRLSDYLFILSRMITKDLQVEEIPWINK
ncbi:MAG TPA: cob(I)yrinic acid a,c-diamide adenosyltransferase [Cyclobacteriaceae bacterium]